ncbi:23051_t:CDS:2 [Rhizophagus irregularis]|nr:23051_t:CDS:2 [Rhizophagus irregularis]
MAFPCDKCNYLYAIIIENHVLIKWRPKAESKKDNNSTNIPSIVLCCTQQNLSLLKLA